MNFSIFKFYVKLVVSIGLAYAGIILLIDMALNSLEPSSHYFNDALCISLLLSVVIGNEHLKNIKKLGISKIDNQHLSRRINYSIDSTIPFSLLIKKLHRVKSLSKPHPINHQTIQLEDDYNFIKIERKSENGICGEYLITTKPRWPFLLVDFGRGWRSVKTIEKLLQS